MTIRQVNVGVGDPMDQHNWGIVKLNFEYLDGYAMVTTVYDADADGKIDLSAGGTDADLSGAAKGSILVCNSNAVIGLIQSSDEYDVPTIQADGTVAWQGGVKTLVVNGDGDVVVNDDGEIVTVEV